ncbi:MULTISPECIES: GGDEF domain-containing protein [Rhodopseudomonas]|uniref:GGDEF domain-containing protein n=1 Tax=Rhodopseudomonas TaxID=1073 RepID=UPI001364CDB7|nr:MULTISPECIES: GGDEF domain-containing protein [Rhodopseudomonas]MDF3813107.1 GGDEF domain-containing protein [Rhodopseudomonas sp. BAL398]WOK19287.1 GGDEF domain-containing protein [Rhodopseudomonas sp. BAL398]
MLAIVGTTLTVGFAAYLTGAVWAYVWLGIELLLDVGRMVSVVALQRATASGRDGDTSSPIILALIWSTTFAVGCAMCVLSGVPALTLLAGMAVAGLAGGISSRNAGTPRFGIAQIVILVTPFALATIFSPIPHLHIVAALFPIYGIGVVVILLENYQILLDLLLSESKNLRLASYDALTGLPNRMMKSKRLAQLLDKKVLASRTGRKPFTVFWLDLDGFKKINDEYGHAAGDAVLVCVADRLRDVVRDDDVIFRIGGDEFVTILPGAAPAEAEAYARRIIARITEPFDLGLGTPLNVGITIGSACFPQDGVTADELLRAADSAMYAAKRRGKGVHVAHGTWSVETVELVPEPDADLGMARRTEKPAEPGYHI